MFILRVSSITPIISPVCVLEANKYLNSKTHKLSRIMNENVIFSRALLEFVGVEVPAGITEVLVRNWQKAAEDVLRTTLHMVVTSFVPLLIIPTWNRMSAKSNELPVMFKELFEHQFVDLVPEKDNEVDNEQFKQKIIDAEGEHGKARLTEYLGDDVSMHNQKISELKKKLLKAKTDVMKWDILSAGLLTYQVSWAQSWFSKNIMGVVGFTGELDYKTDSQRASDTAIFESTKKIRYALGLIPSILGAFWYSDKVNQIATSTKEDLQGSKLKTFLRKNIAQFDYHKKIYSNRLNLMGTFMFGLNSAYILSCRSIAEIIERVLRLGVAYPNLLWVDSKVHSKLAENSDRKNGTLLIDHNADLELGIKKVKPISVMEQELQAAISEGNEDKVISLTKSLKANDKSVGGGLLTAAATMGIGLTLVNVAGTKKNWFGLSA